MLKNCLGKEYMGVSNQTRCVKREIAKAKDLRKYKSIITCNKIRESTLITHH